MIGSRAGLSERKMGVVGAMMVALGPISMALYTPAMPMLVDHFNTSPATIKLTLTVYFAGFALAQLVCGPLADGFGRKPVLLAFLGLYLTGSILALLAWDVAWLLAARTIQGIGAAAGIAISRAMVRDLFHGEQAVRIYALTAAMLAIGPALSPTIGAIALGLLGWHAIFGVMVVYGLVLTVVILTQVPESFPGHSLSFLRPKPLLKNYYSIISDVRFLSPGLVLGVGIGMIYMLATILPFVLIEEAGLTPVQFGLGMMAQSCAYMFGSMLLGRLLPHISHLALLRSGLALFTAGGVAMAILMRSVEPGFFSVMGPIAVSTLGLAFIVPFMTTRALEPFAKTAGTAGALTGFFQMGGGFVGSAAAAMFASPTVAIGTVMPVMAILVLAFHFGLSGSVKRRSLNNKREDQPQGEASSSEGADEN